MELDRRDLIKIGAATTFSFAATPAWAARGTWEPVSVASIPMLDPAPMHLRSMIHRDGNPAAPIPPMSLTKNADLPSALHLIQLGVLSLDTLIRFTPEAVNVGRYHLGFEVDDQITFRDLIMLSNRSSCNQCATQLAITVHGGIEQAVTALNKQAAEWGMRNTRYVSPSGLNVGNDYGATTANDMMLQATWIEGLWGENPIYKIVTSRDPYDYDFRTRAYFDKRGYPKADRLVNGRHMLDSSGEPYLPKNDRNVRFIKSGSWKDKHGIVLRNGLFVKSTPVGNVFISLMAYPLALFGQTFEAVLLSLPPLVAQQMANAATQPAMSEARVTPSGSGDPSRLPGIHP